MKIIEGKVIERIPFRSKDNGIIYTRNLIEVLKVYKGNDDESIEIITLGGTLENENQSWSHGFKLSASSNGIFFLTESPLFENTFIPALDNEGFISFRDYNGHDLFGYGYKKVYTNLTNDVYEPLEEIHGSPRILNLNEHESELLQSQFSLGSSDCVEYIIRNLAVTQSNNILNTNNYYIDFDIDIRSLNQIFQLQKSEITMEYSTSLLGQNIVASNNIVATLGGDFQNYNISLSDAEPNKVKIDIEKIIGQLAYDVNTFQSQIYHASIYIQNFDLSAILNLTVDENFDLKTFKEDGANAPIEISCNQYNQDITVTLGSLLPIDITSYNQTVYAGTKTLLTIEGSNLLNLDGSTQVWFQNANNADILEWVRPYSGDYKPLTSAKIEVYVPSYALDAIDGTNQNKEYAGTGKFKIVHRTNGVTVEESDEKDITVTYAVRNKYYQNGSSGGETQPVMLTQGSGNNGEYIVTYSTAFSGLQDGSGVSFTSAFEEALSSWCTATGLNYVIDENAIQTGNYDLLVDYGTSINGTPITASAPAATLITDFYDSNCSVQIDNGSLNHPETHEVDFTKKMTLMFNSFYAANVFDAGQLMPASLFSVQQIALHELGHAHGILHTNHNGELMYYAEGSAYSITNEASSASNHLQDHSLNLSCVGANGAYQRRANCTTGIIELEKEIQISSRYYDGQVIISSDGLAIVSKFQIYSINGKLIKSVLNTEQYENRLSLKQPNGIYIISYFTEDGIFSDKLLIQE